MKKFIKVLLKYVDVKGLLIEWLLKDYLDKLLDKAVNSTKTPFDNMAKNSLYPVMVEEGEKLLDEQLKKLIADDEK